MSTCGYLRIIKIKIAKDIGIIKAARFPVIWPGDNEEPTINITPAIAKNIEIRVVLEIFSLRKI